MPDIGISSNIVLIPSSEDELAEEKNSKFESVQKVK